VSNKERHRQIAYLNWEETYEGTAPEDLPWFSPTPDPDLLTALDKYAPNPGFALDLGSGPGIHAIALAKRKWKVTAIDIAPGAARMAGRLAKESGVDINFITADILAYRPKPASYDLVHDRGFLHTLHPSSWSRWVDVVATALRPGGLLIAKEFQYNPLRYYGPRGLRESELRGIVDARFAILSMEKSCFLGRAITPTALLLTARRV
jgi:SAM-dependent methyltransferase